MEFLLKTFEIPLWFLIFAFACAAPLWIKWYQSIYKLFFSKATLEDKLSKTNKVTEDNTDVLKKATDNWNESAEHDLKDEELKKSKREHLATEAEQPYVKIVLKTLALNGDAGMLIQSIADTLGINSNEIKSSLLYLEKNEFVEVVAAGTGTKYYLSPRGKRYCIKRGYITE